MAKGVEFWRALEESNKVLTRKEIEEALFEEYGSLVHVKLRELDREFYLTLHFNKECYQIVQANGGLYRIV